MNFIAFIFIILLAVVLHEAGHCITAKAFHIPVTSFNVGVGKKLCGFNRNGTEYNLRLLPFGGSCQIDDDAFDNADPFKKILILAAGPFVNLLLLFAFLFIALCVHGNISLLSLFQTASNGLYNVLVSISSIFSVAFDFENSALQQNFAVADQVLGSATGLDYLYRFSLLSYSINAALFVFNILPIPALDGGQILLNLPAAFGKPLKEQTVNRLNMGFYVFLMGLTVFVFAKDIIIWII